MKPADLRKKSSSELRQELLELRREQFNLRMQQSTGQLSGGHQIRAARRDIARIKTVLREQAAKQPEEQSS